MATKLSKKQQLDSLQGWLVGRKIVDVKYDFKPDGCMALMLDDGSYLMIGTSYFAKGVKI